MSPSPSPSYSQLLDTGRLSLALAPTLTHLHSLIFSATASGEFPKDLCETTGSADASVTSCSLPANSKDGVLEISGLNWTATGKPMDRGPTLPWV